jgi:fumarylpyruvate hydrolase
MDFIFEPPPIVSVPINGTQQRFPVGRIFCVGRNYEEHAREMGFEADREAPFFFMKPADAIVIDNGNVTYPQGTRNFHHEIELVVAVGVGGSNIAPANALEHVFGYAVGNDLTRRDLQIAAREKGRPWDAGKAVEQSAPIGAIAPAAMIGHPTSGRIWLKVNDQIRQDGDLSGLIWSVPELIAFFSNLYHLKPGDLIFTGTPAGVGRVNPGDVLIGGVEGVGEITNRIIQGAG